MWGLSGMLPSHIVRFVNQRNIFLLGIKNEQLPEVIDESLKMLNAKMSSLKIVQGLKNAI